MAIHRMITLPAGIMLGVILCVGYQSLMMHPSNVHRGRSYSRDTNFSGDPCLRLGPDVSTLLFPPKLSSTIQTDLPVAAQLYTRAGHSALRYSDMKADRLAPLTAWTQEQIYKHQHPRDCRAVTVGILPGHPSGLGSEMHVTGANLAFSLNQGLVMVWGQSSCQFFIDPKTCKSTSNCECFFQPLSNCTPDNAGSVQYLSGDKRNEIPAMFEAELKAKAPWMAQDQILYWWRGQSVAYLMRFNDETLAAVASLRKDQSLQHFSGPMQEAFPLPPGVINVHIRGGDKKVEMTLVGASAFVEAARHLDFLNPHAYSKSLFVSADDQNAILECENLLKIHNWSLVYSKIPRMNGGFQFGAFQSADPKVGSLTYAHLMQLLMSLEADAWIGTRGSNWNRLIDELRCIWVDKCRAPFVEVGDVPVADVYGW